MSEEIRLIDRAAIDEQKWQRLVENSNVVVYNQLQYLDALAENWTAVVYGDYLGAMPIPFTIRLGVKGAYTPNFIRSLSWMGTRPHDFSKVFNLLQREFKRGLICLEENLFSAAESRVFQIIHSLDQMQLGSQSKRSVKKFEKEKLAIIPVPLAECLPMVISELKSKVKELKDIDFQRFTQFLENYHPQKCFCFGVKENDEIIAASIIIEWKDTWLYIKGGVTATGKNNGAMHAVMKFVIESSVEQGKKFSFEGSVVPSVQQFNKGFGATDVTYFQQGWNNAPAWFKLLNKIRG